MSSLELTSVAPLHICKRNLDTEHGEKSVTNDVIKKALIKYYKDIGIDDTESINRANEHMIEYLKEIRAAKKIQRLWRSYKECKFHDYYSDDTKKSKDCWNKYFDIIAKMENKSIDESEFKQSSTIGGTINLNNTPILKVSAWEDTSQPGNEHTGAFQYMHSSTPGVFTKIKNLNDKTRFNTNLKSYLCDNDSYKTSVNVNKIGKNKVKEYAKCPQ